MARRQCCIDTCSELSCLERSNNYGKCTEHGGVAQVLRSKISSCSSSTKLRDHAPSELSVVWMQEQLGKQNQRCFYCGITLLLRIGNREADQISPERLDDSVTYLKSNVVLACFSCNFGRNKSQLEDWCDWVRVAYGCQTRTIMHRSCIRNNQWSSNACRDISGWNTRMVKNKFEEQEELCAVTGIQLCRCRVSHCPFAPSIDRLDNAKGHERKNCHMVCMGVNYSRNDMTLEHYKEALERRRVAFHHERVFDFVPPPAIRPAHHPISIDLTATRTCYRCQVNQPLSEYHIHNRFVGEMHRLCRTCKAKDNAARPAKTIRLEKQEAESVLSPGEVLVRCKHCTNMVPEHAMSNSSRGGCKACTRKYNNEKSTPAVRTKKAKHNALRRKEGDVHILANKLERRCCVTCNAEVTVENANLFLWKPKIRGDTRFTLGSIRQLGDKPSKIRERLATKNLVCSSCRGRYKHESAVPTPDSPEPIATAGRMVARAHPIPENSARLGCRMCNNSIPSGKSTYCSQKCHDDGYRQNKAAHMRRKAAEAGPNITQRRIALREKMKKGEKTFECSQCGEVKSDERAKAKRSGNWCKACDNADGIRIRQLRASIPTNHHYCRNCEKAWPKVGPSRTLYKKCPECAEIAAAKKRKRRKETDSNPTHVVKKRRVAAAPALPEEPTTDNLVSYVSTLARNRGHVVPIFAVALRDPSWGEEADWGAINKAVLERWSPAALKFIKREAAKSQ